MLFVLAATTTLVATGGFGTFPNNPATQALQQSISANLSSDYLDPFNDYLESLAVPTIPPGPASQPGLPFDPIGAVEDIFAEEPPPPTVDESSIVSSAVASILQTVTQLIPTATITGTPTLTITPTVSPSATLSPTISPTVTLAPVVIFIPPTRTPRPTDAAPTDDLTATVLASTTTPAASTSTPVSYLVLYDGGSSNGNLVDRTSVNALCTDSLPSGFSKAVAFIGFTSTDTVSNIPSTYGIPTGVPIKSTSNVVVANNWADLLDGTIATTLSSAGVVSSYWWSGMEKNGTSLDGSTADCNNWTSSANTDSGNYGDFQQTDTRWITGAATNVCDQTLAILCIGY